MAFTWALAGSSTPTGVRLLVVVSLPSCPSSFAPQARTAPRENSAMVWPQPATSETRCPIGLPVGPPCIGPMLTGVSLLVVVPSPNCPRLLAPQTYTPPPETLTKAKLNPADRMCTLLPVGSWTRTGTPPETLTKAKLNPADRICTLLPVGSWTRTGTPLLVVVPLPS